MRALVVYESMFGNTRAVAEAVAQGLSGRMEVDLAEVASAPDDVAVDLVVAGGPTHAFSMSRPATRRSALEQSASGEVVSRGRGLREWLAAAGPRLRGAPVAAFDTRITTTRLSGSAAKAAQRRLRRSGARIVAPAESFSVGGTTGPLGEGELERAKRWGADLAQRCAEPAAPAGTG